MIDINIIGYNMPRTDVIHSHYTKVDKDIIINQSQFTFGTNNNPETEVLVRSCACKNNNVIFCTTFKVFDVH